MQNDLINELGTNFIEYAVAVNSDRAIPDATSGLKPVARRILWSAFDNGQLSNKPHVKSAKIVGNVMGALHPHGDSSIYGAMVRLSQDWVMRYPLIDWHGNNGNIAGDGAASMRYTEARLSKLAEDGLLQGIKKKNVKFIPTYDESDEEPLTLPAIFPNLLCNPNTGIGVAIACNWLPHNLGEVAQAIFDYMDGKEPTLPGPDFPTGGVVINSKDIPTIMKTGHGTIKVRGKYTIENQNIIFTEIPYAVTIEEILNSISAACDSKDIEGINEVQDQSNKKGIRIVIECDRGINPESIVKKLFAKTNLQSSISYNQVGLIDKTPTELNLVDCIKIYIEHNQKCLVAETQYDLAKAKERLNIVEGLLIALENIDNVIALIKSSASAAAAKASLMKKYNLSEEQAKSILDMKLSRLAKLEKTELETEKKDLIAAIDNYQKLLTSEALQLKEIKNRLTKLVKEYGDNRRTELINIDEKPEDKEIITVVPEDVVVILNKAGEIKRVAKSAFKPQRKGGKGVQTAGESVIGAVSTNTIDSVLLFSDKGQMYRLLVDKVPAGTNASKGISLHSLFDIAPGEHIIAMTSLDRQNDKKYVVFITKQGLLKKTALTEYVNTKKATGIQAIKLKEGDSIASIELMNEENILLISEQGFAIQFETKDINPIGRITSGVKAMKLSEGDQVLVGLPINNEVTSIGVFSTKGYGKRISLEELPVQGRGGKGLSIYKEPLAGAAALKQDSIISLIGKKSITIRVEEVPLQSRGSAGQKMIQDGEITSIVVM